MPPPRVELAGGPVAVDERSVFRRFIQLVPVHGATVLEVGGSLDPSIAEAAGARSWIAVDPRNPHGARSGIGYTIRSSAHRTGLVGGTVDAVFSCNALQHIQPLAELFAELHRVLRPGGRAYFNFGPVWSGPDGSHIERFEHGGRYYDFWNDTLLPPWSHLVLSRAELAELLAAAHGPAFGMALSHWVHTTPWLNRVPLHQLLQLASTSLLRVRSVRGTAEFGYRYRPPEIDHRLVARLDRASVAGEAWARHGIPAEHLDVRDVELILEKPR